MLPRAGGRPKHQLYGARHLEVLLQRRRGIDEHVLALFDEARAKNVPLFSASSLRWIPGALELRGGTQGAVEGADAFSWASLEPTHPDLYWYGIHGVEILYTVMGTGCRSVRARLRNLSEHLSPQYVFRPSMVISFMSQ